MTASDLLSSLEMAFGGILPAPRASASSKRLIEMSVNGDTFEKLLRHWASMPAVSRPRARGLTRAREEARALELLIEVSPRAPFVLVLVGADWPARSLTGVWPYAAWWEEELAGFEGVPFASRAEDSGVAWRRA